MKKTVDFSCKFTVQRKYSTVAFDVNLQNFFAVLDPILLHFIVLSQKSHFSLNRLLSLVKTKMIEIGKILSIDYKKNCLYFSVRSEGFFFSTTTC